MGMAGSSDRIMKSVDPRRGQTPKMPRRSFRSRIRACGLSIVLLGPLLIAAAGYVTYSDETVIHLLAVYVFLLLPLGFLLLGYSVSRRWLRIVVAVGFLASAWITYYALNAVPSRSEPTSAVLWYGLLYGPFIGGPAFVLALVRVENRNQCSTANNTRYQEPFQLNRQAL